MVNEQTYEIVIDDNGNALDNPHGPLGGKVWEDAPQHSIPVVRDAVIQAMRRSSVQPTTNPEQLRRGRVVTFQTTRQKYQNIMSRLMQEPVTGQELPNGVAT